MEEGERREGKGDEESGGSEVGKTNRRRATVERRQKSDEKDERKGGMRGAQEEAKEKDKNKERKTRGRKNRSRKCSEE